MTDKGLQELLMKIDSMTELGLAKRLRMRGYVRRVYGKEKIDLVELSTRSRDELVRTGYYPQKTKEA